ncbi:hypothetical protein H0H92_009509, partial [Tricholoma furcatifolium]
MHNHPILPAVKASHDIKALFNNCIDAVGVVGATVRSIEQAPSTNILMKGKNPALYNPALQNMRMKQDILRTRKQEAFPDGVDVAGVWNALRTDLKKPLQDRYIHNIMITPSGGMLIFTFQPYLLDLIHHAKSLYVDTTFKRAAGDLKEVEIVMWVESVQQAVTIGRVYTDSADRSQYKSMFDELQRLITAVTGKPLLLKRLSKEGTLISFNFDLEIAQVLGVGDSFASTNEPEYSGIPDATPVNELVQYFTRSCYVHVKRGLKNLEKFLDIEQFDRLSHFMYLKTPDDVQEFGVWIKTLKVKEIQGKPFLGVSCPLIDWWTHKINNVWILPSIIQCLTKLAPEDWAITQSTSNLVESQHHWTNVHTGIKHSLLEAILTAQKLDKRTADEINSSLTTGVLRNSRNDIYNRMSRSVSRATAEHHKAQVIHHRNEQISDINKTIESLTQTQKEGREQLKAAKAKKKELSTRRTGGYHAESSSSGRVPSARHSKTARTTACPYNIRHSAEDKSVDEAHVMQTA